MNFAQCRVSGTFWAMNIISRNRVPRYFPYLPLQFIQHIYLFNENYNSSKQTNREKKNHKKIAKKIIIK